MLLQFLFHIKLLKKQLWLESSQDKNGSLKDINGEKSLQLVNKMLKNHKKFGKKIVTIHFQ